MSMRPTHRLRALEVQVEDLNARVTHFLTNDWVEAARQLAAIKATQTLLAGLAVAIAVGILALFLRG